MTSRLLGGFRRRRSFQYQPGAGPPQVLAAQGSAALLGLPRFSTSAPLMETVIVQQVEQPIRALTESTTELAQRLDVVVPCADVSEELPHRSDVAAAPSRDLDVGQALLHHLPFDEPPDRPVAYVPSRRRGIWIPSLWVARATT